jgi:orotidine-5'-phosphate decarboxylase
MTELIVALDDPDLDSSERLAASLGGVVAGLKVGLTLFARHGPEALLRIGRHGPVFCDLKLHDIPQQVSRAAGELAAGGAWIVTVHASGGAEMVGAAVDGARGENPATVIAGVTVLTSLDVNKLAKVGQGGSLPEQAERLARLALGAGAGGLVCSGAEAARLKALGGDAVMVIVPGVRPVGAERGDQARVVTPAAAAASGADLIVVGRPITGAPDPVAAAVRISEEISGLPNPAGRTAT